jgi:hypothetical protein
MRKYKIIFSLILSALIVTTAYCQGNLGNNQTITVSGTVTQTDFVSNTITILTADQQQMVFSVPGNAIITRGTNDIGLMDIKAGHPVTVQYTILSPGKDIVVSVVDNKPVTHE